MGKDFAQRYAELAHAVQSGVAIELQFDSSSGSPKHLRTGLNLALVMQGTLVRLLIEKGVFTEQEYERALLVGVENEKHAYEARLSERFGKDIRLE